MSSSPRRPAPSRSALVWSTVVVLAALGILLGGGTWSNFAPEPSGLLAEDIRLPEPLEPLGDLEHPPTVFRWVPGGDDVSLSQVVLFDENQKRIWESAPLTGTELVVDPETVFANLAAGPAVLWSVREVSVGRPRATSPLVGFSFAVDVHGRGIGESTAGDILIDW